MSRTRDLADLINGISAAKITSGSLDAARLSNIDSDYVQLRQATADLTNLNASNLTSGTIPNARVSSSAVTQHVSAVTQATGTWTPNPNHGGLANINATYARTGNIVTCVASFKFDGTGRSSTSTSEYRISGLPITPRSGSVVVGAGSYSFYKGQGLSGVIRVLPGDTTLRFYGTGPDIQTGQKYTSGGADELHFFLGAQGDDGFVMTLQNMYRTMDTNRYGHLFVVYQV